jgi:hypothetical protein
LKGFKVIACRTWLEDARSGAWAVAIFATAAGDNALRQTEARPTHHSMVIGETPQSKGRHRTGMSGRSIDEFEGLTEELAGFTPDSQKGRRIFEGEFLENRE